MDFKDSIKQISERVEKLKDNLLTEEATKNALILPFLQVLGYDVFNPLEVLPEMSCDIGIKKGEKIDYAIMKEGKPIILVECKHWQQDLILHDNQLLRYFNVSEAKFGILTNGIIYKIFTDLKEPNKMDAKPFLEINMLDLKENQIEELKKFHKSYFDIEIILSSANELKYTSELKAIIAKEFTNPDIEFVRYFGKQVYDGVFHSKIAEQFATLVKRSIQSYINDLIADRLKAAIKEDVPKDVEITKEIVLTKGLPEGVVYANEDRTIITTQEELEAFYIVRSMLRPIINSDRIYYKDTQSYFAVFIDNIRKTICRFYFSKSNKRITFFDENSKEIRNTISSLDDIYSFSESIINIVNRFL